VNLSVYSAYALHGLVYLARHGGGPVSAHEIAAATGLSAGSMRKVLHALIRPGFVRSHRPPGGGYNLAHDRRRITVLGAVEWIDGGIRGHVPVRWLHPPWWDSAAGRRVDARLKVVCDALAEGVRRRLRRVTLAELAGER
jgi:Rrf2 family protein